VNIVAINASFGGGGSNSTEQAAIQAAEMPASFFAPQRAITQPITTAPLSIPHPTVLPSMIVVAATDQNDNLASFSDYGAATVGSCCARREHLFAPYRFPRRPSLLCPAGLDDLLRQPIDLFRGHTSTGNQRGLSITATGLSLQLSSRGQRQYRPDPARTLLFSDKVGNAMAAGARAAVISTMLSATSTEHSRMQAIGFLRSPSRRPTDKRCSPRCPRRETVVNATDPTKIYQYLDGTSMATPHVSERGVRAMNFRAENATQRVHRILANVTPIAGLQGKVITGGRLNLARTVDTDSKRAA